MLACMPFQARYMVPTSAVDEVCICRARSHLHALARQSCTPIDMDACRRHVLHFECAKVLFPRTCIGQSLPPLPGNQRRARNPYLRKRLRLVARGGLAVLGGCRGGRQLARGLGARAQVRSLLPRLALRAARPAMPITHRST